MKSLSRVVYMAGCVFLLTSCDFSVVEPPNLSLDDKVEQPGSSPSEWTCDKPADLVHDLPSSTKEAADEPVPPGSGPSEWTCHDPVGASPSEWTCDEPADLVHELPSATKDTEGEFRDAMGRVEDIYTPKKTTRPPPALYYPWLADSTDAQDYLPKRKLGSGDDACPDDDRPCHDE